MKLENARNAFVSIEGNSAEFETVLKIETDLTLSSSELDEAVVDLILAAQRYLRDNPHIDRFTISSHP